MSDTNQTDKNIDSNPDETREWLEALEDVVAFETPERAKLLLSKILSRAHALSVDIPVGIHTPYLNTISPKQQAKMPDDGKMMQRLNDYMRWNAVMMVVKASRSVPEVGGHLSSYASIATLYEVGLTYFFHAPTKDHDGDLILFQGHSSPGIYARAFLEGRLTEGQLDHFRQEIGQPGLTSYPHPWLMPDFWQFPTVSMGLGPLMAIYQARFMNYLDNRKLADTRQRKVWAFCGDGELGEPESLGALNLAGREKLDNLIFVINCNLQRLDGPVWANGQILQEYAALFAGAGWNVIKVIWGSGWDELFAKDQAGDQPGKLLQRISELIDGEYQNYASKGGEFFREDFFGKYPETLALVADKTDEELKQLLDGGHDPQKVYAAYAAAIAHKGQPTVILAKTVKGFGLGTTVEGLNIAHNAKKMSFEHLCELRDRFNLDLTDKQVENLEYITLKKDSPEAQYLHGQREKLGGFLPARDAQAEKLPAPKLEAFAKQLESTGDREISSTMSYVRILSTLLKDKALSKHIVPIVADESRTFGMEGLFRQIGIYSPFGQNYEPEDKHLLMYYKEAKTGQLIQDGISEAGAMCTWLAAATSYANHNIPMIPFYIYYSQFGYQRFGDLVWLAGDMRARGFIIGGTAGRTTLAGEGLQHQDGHNLLAFNFIPNCISYDPTFSYEMAVIVRDGLRRMEENQEDVFYYITAMNENYHHPAMPENSEAGIIKGMYLFQAAKKVDLRLLGSGAIFNEVVKAAEILKKDYKLSAEIWSATSFNELRRDLLSVQRHNHLHPDEKAKTTYVAECLQDDDSPVIAATDYIKLYAEQISSEIKAPYYVLGTDGFGRSDTRAALRDHFEVDAKFIAYTALKALADAGKFDKKDLQAAIKKLNIDTGRVDPVLS